MESARKSHFELDFQALIDGISDDKWNVGLIVGPSGSGKSSVARALFPGELKAFEGMTWAPKKAVVDNFPKDASVTDICELLSSVGFASPPAWLRPFEVLSNGEKFRASVARQLADGNRRMVIDEFTSVVDRTVAKIGSHAIQKTTRRLKKQLVAVSCHYDVIDWLQPDWIFEPAKGSFQRRALRRRPEIKLQIFRPQHDAWREFSRHHYLDAKLNRSARLLVGNIEGENAVFIAILPVTFAKKSTWRISRIVTKPDFQGVGLATNMSTLVGGALKAHGSKLTIVTSHPAMVRSLLKGGWEIGRNVSRYTRKDDDTWKGSSARLTVALRYNGPSNATLDPIWKESGW